MFGYTVTDEFGATSTANLTITITGTNDTPVANGDSNATDAVVESGVNPANTPLAGDATAAGNVLTNDTDVDTGHVLTVAAVAGVAANVGTAVIGIYGSVTIASDGSYSYTLNNSDPDTQALAQGAPATDVFSYTVTDQFGATSTANLTINIAGTNDAPVISTAGIQKTAGPGGQATFSGISVSDIDATAGEIFTVSASAASGHSVAGSGPGTLSAITTTLNAGIVYGSGTTPPTDMITLSVTDAHGGSDKVNFIFQSASPPPTAPVTLASTSEKDVLFGTGNPDQFVFTSNSNRDTIVDFTAGTDHIDLSALSSIVNSTTLNNFFATSRHVVRRRHPDRAGRQRHHYASQCPPLLSACHRLHRSRVANAILPALASSAPGYELDPMMPGHRPLRDPADRWQTAGRFAPLNDR